MRVRTHRISNARQKAVLASPVRQDLLDSLGAAGRATAGELAEQLGMRRSAVYYHLELLEAAQLVSCRRDHPKAEAIYGARAPCLVVDHDTSSAGGRQASLRIARALLRAAERDFARGLGHPAARARPPGRNLWVSRGKGWLTPAEIEAVLAHLEAIDRLVLRARRGAGRTLCAVSSVLAPVGKER